MAGAGTAAGAGRRPDRGRLVLRDARVGGAGHHRIGDDVNLALGPKHDRLSIVDKAHLARLFAAEALIDLGTYDADFAATSSNVADEQTRFIRESGWWNNSTRLGGGSPSKITLAIVIGVVLLLFINAAAFLASGLAVFGSPAFAIALGFVVPFLVGLVVYSSMVPSRTATGSALALRTESFRRFLAVSEGKHVDWAWEHNVLRE